MFGSTADGATKLRHATSPWVLWAMSDGEKCMPSRNWTTGGQKAKPKRSRWHCSEATQAILQEGPLARGFGLLASVAILFACSSWSAFVELGICCMCEKASLGTCIAFSSRARERKVEHGHRLYHRHQCMQSGRAMGSWSYASVWTAERFHHSKRSMSRNKAFIRAWCGGGTPVIRNIIFFLIFFVSWWMNQCFALVYVGLGILYGWNSEHVLSDFLENPNNSRAFRLTKEQVQLWLCWI